MENILRLCERSKSEKKQRESLGFQKYMIKGKNFNLDTVTKLKYQNLSENNVYWRFSKFSPGLLRYKAFVEVNIGTK